MNRTVRNGSSTLSYTLVRTGRHDISMRVLPDGETRVYAPSYVPLREIDSVVKAHMGELTAMADKLKSVIEKNRLTHPVAPGSRICVEGEAYELTLERAGRTSYMLADGKFVLRTPHADDEESVRAALRQVLSRLALMRIRERLDEYAPRLKVRYGRVTIREQKTRWGSCSSKGNLNFNWKLIMAPKPVLDYVVLHELCHLREFNHSAKFWQLVKSEMPEYESCIKWLKLHGKELGVG